MMSTNLLMENGGWRLGAPAGKITFLGFHLTVVALTLGAAVILLSLLVFNPGFYSHDELQKLDHVKAYGLKHYLSAYLAIAPGQEFGVPVRPFAFLVQGFYALFMEPFPVLVHLADVLMHGVVACLLYFLTMRLFSNRTLAIVATLLFIVSPLTTLAVGWSAALMDRLYVLWGLVMLLFGHRYINRSGHPSLNLAGVVLSSTLAILSKETALVNAALLLLLCYPDRRHLLTARFWILTAAAALPAMIFLAIRLPALLNSFDPANTGVYGASLAPVPGNILAYFTYPFLLHVTEAHQISQVSTVWILVACLLHMLLLGFLVRNHGWMAGASYLFFYVLFLLPVLLIPSRGAHYLYGSGLAVSIVVAGLICARRGMWLSRAVGIGIAVLYLGHAVAIQRFVYDTGVCMDRLTTTTRAAYAAAGQPGRVTIYSEPGAPHYVLVRTFHDRAGALEHFSSVTVTDPADKTPGASVFRMNVACEVSQVGH